MAFAVYTPYRTRDGSPITVIFACGPNVMVNVIIGLFFLCSTGSIMDMNDNVLDMTAVDKHPFPIDYCVPSTKTPVAGTYTAKVNMSYFGEFLTELDTSEAYVHVRYMAPPLHGGAK